MRGASSVARVRTLLLIEGVTWGASYSVARIVTSSGVDPVGLTMWQSFLIAGLMLPFAKWPKLTRSSIRFLVVTAVFGTALPSVVWFAVTPHLPAGLLGVVNAISPMMALSICLALSLEIFAIRRVLGIAFGFVAVLMLVVPKTSLPGAGMAGWVLLLLAMPLCYAAEGIIIATMRPPKERSTTLLCGMQVIAGVLLLPIAVSRGGAGWPAAFGPTLLWFVLLGALNAATFLLYLEVIRRAGAVFASQSFYLVPVTGILWGYFLLGEKPSPWVFGAIAATLLGLALVRPAEIAPAVVREEPEEDGG